MATPKKDKETAESASGPFWVESNKSGHKFVWPFVPDGHKDTGDSPFDVNGRYRKAEPSVESSPAQPTTTEGIVP